MEQQQQELWPHLPRELLEKVLLMVNTDDQQPGCDCFEWCHCTPRTPSMPMMMLSTGLRDAALRSTPNLRMSNPRTVRDLLEAHHEGSPLYETSSERVQLVARALTQLRRVGRSLPFVLTDLKDIRASDFLQLLADSPELPCLVELGLMDVCVQERSLPAPAHYGFGKFANLVRLSCTVETSNFFHTCRVFDVGSLDLSRLQHLKHLHLHGFGTYVKALDLSGNPALEQLDISCWWRLQSLDLITCTNLRKVDMKFDYSLCRVQWPQPSCPALTHLNMARVKAPLPEDLLSAMPGLIRLNAGSCSAVATLNVAGMEHLEVLKCHECTNLTEVLGMNHCPRLQRLVCGGNPRFLTLNVPTSLTSLSCWECPNLSHLHGLAGCDRLRMLDCEECPQLTHLDLRGMSSIKSVYARDCANLSEIILSASLERLDISRCPRDVDLVGLSDCPELVVTGP